MADEISLTPLEMVDVTFSDPEENVTQPRGEGWQFVLLSRFGG
jgi:hypothetical protein